MHRGHVDDADVAALRAAGLDDEEIAEVVGHVAINVFTNLFNSAARTDVDFPAAPPLKHAASARRPFPSANCPRSAQRGRVVQ